MPQESVISPKRLIAFSDGIFAVAVTLLVFDLIVPELSGPATSEKLVEGLHRNWPGYLSFLGSFVTVFIMWVNHHNIFRLIERVDTNFLYVNGVCLLLLSIVPFPTKMVSRFITTDAAPVAAACYSGLFVLINLSCNWFVFHASRAGLWRPHAPAAVIRGLRWKFALGFPGYLIATGVAFWSPYLSLGISFGLWILWAFMAYDPSDNRKAAGGEETQRPV